MKNHSLNKMSVVSVLSAMLLQACSVQDDQLAMPVKQVDDVEQKIKSIMSTMTLEQKIGQMLQPEIRSITPAEVEQYHIGSILNGGGAFPANNKHASIQEWVALADEYYHASMSRKPGRTPIPIIWGTDAVHGHNNVIGATLFPHNIGLGAANNPALIEKIAQITAKEVAVTGIDWTFAPTLAVVRDDRWGRTYESYSEDPAIVKTYAKSMVQGLQGRASDAFSSNHIVATAKHFVGDGGTEFGDDQGNTQLSESELFKIHAQGYYTALDADVQTVMVSYSSWNGQKMHGQKYLITDVLKNKMAFDGIVVSDWNGIGQVAGCTNDNCAAAINAGIDLFMVPDTWKTWIANTLSQVKSGIVPMSRIDDAVTRILRVKLRTGLFEAGAPSTRELAGRSELVGSTAHREVAKQAVRESLVLLKNNNDTLPLSPELNILVAGEGADNIPMQNGGWTISWQGTGNVNGDFPGGSSIYQGIKDKVESAGGQALLSKDGHYITKPDVAVVVVGEQPYTEFLGDIQNLESLEFEQKNKKTLRLLQSLKEKGIPTVTVLLSGRPLWVNKEINKSDAFVAAWLPGTEGDAIADVLFKTNSGDVNHDFSGKLSFSWPGDACQSIVNVGDADYNPLFQYGYGLTYQDKHTVNLLSEKGAALLGCQLQSGKPKSPLLVDLTTSQWQVFIDSAAGQHTPVDHNEIITPDVTVKPDQTGMSVTANFNPNSQSTISIRSDELVNLLPYLAHNATLNWLVRVNSPFKGNVKARIDCGLPCSGDVDITDALQRNSVGEWQTLSIDLACYVPGTDLRKVISPFVITASDALSINLAGGSINIADKPADIQCAK
ncbi:glycoside hydrolase family 3 protein [Algibacillus agarilyticus]|uniref:glycoside hydrolase family 3 protein n=1 Tax=Algibacillus agarilyticus TaxID=2234133 RepID=UPI000DD04C8E|nr:glycoside hydrolase family 3 protein [Algibacillus agarilyticus]